MQKNYTFDTVETMARYIIEQGHIIEIPEPLFYNDELPSACETCGARLTITLQGSHDTSATLSADVEERLLEKCAPVPTYVFSWPVDESEEDEGEGEGDEDEEVPL